MPTNKEIIQMVNDGFVAGDTETILSHVADDVRWDVVGISTANGKEEFRREVENENFEGKPDITIRQAIEEGDLRDAFRCFSEESTTRAHAEIIVEMCRRQAGGTSKGHAHNGSCFTFYLSQQPDMLADVEWGTHLQPLS